MELFLSGFEWLIVCAGPILFVLALLPSVLKRARQRGQNLSKSVDQLSSRLRIQIETQSSGLRQETDSCVSEKILQALQSSINQIRADEVFSDSSALSSIYPAQESVQELSKRLSGFDLDQNGQNKSQALDLTSLAVIYIRSNISEVIRVNEMAQALRVSKRVLYNSLKESLGCPAQELINVIKMQEAKRLLKKGDLLVKEVVLPKNFNQADLNR